MEKPRRGWGGGWTVKADRQCVWSSEVLGAQGTPSRTGVDFWPRKYSTCWDLYQSTQTGTGSLFCVVSEQRGRLREEGL